MHSASVILCNLLIVCNIQSTCLTRKSFGNKTHRPTFQTSLLMDVYSPLCPYIFVLCITISLKVCIHTVDIAGVRIYCDMSWMGNRDMVKGYVQSQC